MHTVVNLHLVELNVCRHSALLLRNASSRDDRLRINDGFHAQTGPRSGGWNNLFHRLKSAV